jgi:hypothetical protein
VQMLASNFFRKRQKSLRGNWINNSRASHRGNDNSRHGNSRNGNSRNGNSRNGNPRNGNLLNGNPSNSNEWTTGLNDRFGKHWAPITKRHDQKGTLLWSRGGQISLSCVPLGQLMIIQKNTGINWVKWNQVVYW